MKIRGKWRSSVIEGIYYTVMKDTHPDILRKCNAGLPTLQNIETVILEHIHTKEPLRLLEDYDTDDEQPSRKRKEPEPYTIPEWANGDIFWEMEPRQHESIFTDDEDDEPSQESRYAAVLARLAATTPPAGVPERAPSNGASATALRVVTRRRTARGSRNWASIIRLRNGALSQLAEEAEHTLGFAPAILVEPKLSENADDALSLLGEAIDQPLLRPLDGRDRKVGAVPPALAEVLLGDAVVEEHCGVVGADGLRPGWG